LTAVRDTYLIFRRHIRVFYGPLATRTLRSSGVPADEAWQLYVPGVLVQLALFGAAFVGFAVIADWRAGTIERLRVTPVSRLSLLLGRVLRDVVLIVAQAVLLVVVAIPFGLRAPVVGVLVGLVFVALMALGLASVSSALGLALKSEDSLGPLVNTGLMPLMLLSGVLLPMAFAPTWLNTVSRLTPFRYVVEAMRQAFRGNVLAPDVLLGAAVTVVLVALAVWAGVRTYLRQSA
jgi:ABC-2 type transport system permease protein